MPFAENPDPILAEEGVEAVVGAAPPVLVLFDAPTRRYQVGEDAVVMTDPQICGRAADLAGASEGTAVAVAGGDYFVVGAPETDGTWTKLYLSFDRGMP